MKKMLFAICVIALAASSCSKDVTVSSADDINSAVGFKTYVPFSTRGTVISGTTLPTTSNFDVFAFQGSTQFMGTSATDGTNISYVSSAWNYTTATEKKYWSSTKTDFYMVSPSGIGTENFTSTAQTITYTTPTAVADQVDMLYAFVKQANRIDRDGEGNTTTPATGAVPTIFKHAMSQIVFKVKTNDATLKVDIKSIEIDNVMSVGTFTYPTVGTNATTPGVGTWGTLGTSADFAAGITTTTGIQATATDVMATNGALLLIPQTLSAWTTVAATPVTIASADAAGKSYLKVECKIIDSSTSTDVYLYGDASSYGYIYIPFSATWASGNKYTYTLNFGKADTDSTGGGYDVNGNPIFNMLITFNPSVTDWTDQSSTLDL